LIDWLLGDYLIVSDEETQKRIHREHGVSVVTTAGDLISSQGLLRTPWYARGKRVAGVGRKSELKRLSAEIKSLESEQEKLTEKVKREQEKLESLRKQFESRKRALKRYEEQNFHQQVQLARDRETYQKTVDLIQNVSQEIERTGNAIQEAHEKINRLMPAIEQLSKRKEQFEKESQRLLDKVQELEEERNQLAEVAHELNLNLVRTTAEKKNIQSEIERMERTVRELTKTLATRDREIGEAETDIEYLEGVIEKAHTALAELYSRRDALVKDKNRLQSDLENLRTQLKTKENEVKQAREAGESSSDMLRNLKLKLSELELRADNIKHNMNEKYAIEVVPAEPKTPTEFQEIAERLELLRKRLQNFGPVNLLSLEEYEKESKRMEFLEKQRDDLLEAKNTLLETISVINKTAHDKFYDVFQKIRENFRKNIQSFFDGGEGDIHIKFNPDDPLEADISIKVRPRGKAISSMDLLSAGEKALTAITLLFSIYQVKPSPFCVLDEVDAPLDDVSLHRFLKVVRDFSDTVQFILVTHNKVTMEASDNIYGVTMAEEGISKLVSVRFEKEETSAEISS